MRPCTASGNSLQATVTRRSSRSTSGGGRVRRASSRSCCVAVRWAGVRECSSSCRRNWAWAPLANQNSTGRSQAKRQREEKSMFIGPQAERRVEKKHAPPVEDGAFCRLAGEDGLGQFQVAGLQGRRVAANHLKRGLQLGATDFATAGDEAGGVLTSGLDDLVVAGGQVGAGFGGTDQGAADHVGGADEAGGAGQGRQAQQGCGAEQANQGHGVCFLCGWLNLGSECNQL